jgi:hypothetical protein
MSVRRRVVNSGVVLNVDLYSRADCAEGRATSRGRQPCCRRRRREPLHYQLRLSSQRHQRRLSTRSFHYCIFSASCPRRIWAICSRRSGSSTCASGGPTIEWPEPVSPSTTMTAAQRACIMTWLQTASDRRADSPPETTDGLKKARSFCS